MTIRGWFARRQAPDPRTVAEIVDHAIAVVDGQLYIAGTPAAVFRSVDEVLAREDDVAAYVCEHYDGSTTRLESAHG